MTAISIANYNGSFTVTGDGGGASNGSGGTIQRTTSHAVNLSAIVGTVSLGYMNIADSGANGINAASINNLTINHCNISDAAGNVAVDDGVKLTNTTGTIAITASAITGSRHQGVTIDNLNTNLAGLTMTSTTVSGTVAGDGMLVQMRGTSVLTSGTIGGASAANGNTFSNNSATGLQVVALDTSNVNLTVKNNAANGNNAGMDLDLTQAATMTLGVESNYVQQSAERRAELLQWHVEYGRNDDRHRAQQQHRHGGRIQLRLLLRRRNSRGVERWYAWSVHDRRQHHS